MKKNQPFDYVVYLQRPDYRKYDLVSTILILIAIAGLSFFAFYENLNSLSYFIIIILLLYQLFVNRRLIKEEETAGFENSFFVIAVSFLLLPTDGSMHFIIAILYVVAAIFERQVKFQQQLGFDSNGITINSLPKKHYRWSEIQNALLKEGFLTIDLKNNRIFQKEIDLDISPFLEAEFNEFCRLQLNAQYLRVSSAN
ncbi:MAG TPA: hypothetical protein PKM63_14620 [Panacibacter sp.]|nr:hypothetical protein [Panacibacter sp.]HNP45522.1 hypothetical protein [Panacibacter sp.]